MTRRGNDAGDWLLAYPRSGVVHLIDAITWSTADAGIGRAVCGMVGRFTRPAADPPLWRCSTCCALRGIPTGSIRRGAA